MGIIGSGLTPTEQIEAVSERVRDLPGYPDFAPCAPAYTHIGALLVDAGLQAAIDYEAVVAPRVKRVLERWPDATTTDLFLRRVEAEGLRDVLDWRDETKLARVLGLATLLKSEGVQTVSDLGVWIERSGSRQKLLDVRGIGPKTADYIANMAGQPVLAVDRHVRTFVTAAGVDTTRYNDVHELLAAVADNVGVNLGALDRAIWQQVSRANPSRVGDVRVRATAPLKPTGERLTPTVEDLAQKLARATIERDEAILEIKRLRRSGGNSRV